MGLLRKTDMTETHLLQQSIWRRALANTVLSPMFHNTLYLGSVSPTSLGLWNFLQNSSVNVAITAQGGSLPISIKNPLLLMVDASTPWLHGGIAAVLQLCCCGTHSIYTASDWSPVLKNFQAGIKSLEPSHKQV